MATILRFPSNYPSKSAPHLLQPVPASHAFAQNRIARTAPSLAMASQIAVAVSRVDQEIARIAARTNIHHLPA
jgi:hypothetical protein